MQPNTHLPPSAGSADRFDPKILPLDRNAELARCPLKKYLQNGIHQMGEEKMFLQEFEYIKPTNIKAACEIKKKYGDRCALLAGGTDLFVQIRNNKKNVEYVIDLKGIQGLDRIDLLADGSWRIGALTCVNSLSGETNLGRRAPVLLQAVDMMASIQVRNKATIGGNICNASPAADLVPPLLILDAFVEIASPTTSRTVPLERFFVSHSQTVLQADEMLTAVLIPWQESPIGQSYQKFGRNSMDLAIVGVACGLRVDDHKKCTFARVALGAVAPVPLRARRTEDFLLDKELSEELFEVASSLSVTESSPISDVRASDEYRRDLIEILTCRALRGALQDLGKTIKGV